MRRFAHHEPVPLDTESMKIAAQALEGRHNFRAFTAAGEIASRAPESQGKRPDFVRILSHCHIAEEDGLLKMSFVGNGFLYNMVRILAGTLVSIGRQKNKESFHAPVETIRMILQSQDRTRAGATLPPHGLILRHVEYQLRKPSAVFADLPETSWEQLLTAPPGSATHLEHSDNNSDSQ
jgi:tRNA pseudouridine38-40 synthase